MTTKTTKPVVGRRTGVASCAVCTSVTGPFTLEPLGRDDALVNVCAACSAPAFEKCGPERGYEPKGGLLSAPMLTEAMRRIMGSAEYERQMKLADATGRLAWRTSNFDPNEEAARHVEHDGRAKRINTGGIGKGRGVGMHTIVAQPEDVDGEAAYIARRKGQR